jgi:integrase
VCKIRYRKEERTRLRFLETEEEERLLTASREPLRSIILLGIHTGLRIQAEALTLQWSSVDLRRASLMVEAAYAKNGRTRSVPLNSTVLQVLKRLKETSTGELVFPYQSIGTSFRYACRRAKLIGVTPHTLRHTFASRLVMAGVDLRTVQELGGWQTLAMVERYAHLSPAHK